MDFNVSKILFMGAPSTGKTSLINALKGKGFVCYEEISRQVTQEARDEGIEHLFLEQPLLFSEKLLEGRIRQFLSANSVEQSPVFIDRGLPDITAYLDMIKKPYPERFNNANQEYRYDIVFWFPFWEDIYTADEERYENLNLAKTIEKYLLKSYKMYNYDLIEMPKSSLEERLNFLLSYLNLT
ncbi:AAA family ATPase [Mesohalobacter halotolerans]|uniref:ATP-binding protein n=1 Tax=Mesohalobacter halotolerans TaxID=1883405 RepID=A0A4V6ALC0_9FLAO|nr:ATP-binding protein [Mesohalobacter halotolerans]TKS56085.1 ATP-binding protein [Mesohalobacter halotolerans]